MKYKILRLSQWNSILLLYHYEYHRTVYELRDVTCTCREELKIICVSQYKYMKLPKPKLK